MNPMRSMTRLMAVYLVVVTLTSTRASGQSSNELLKRGLDAIARKDLDRAIADFDQVIRLDPKNVSAHYHRGWSWNRKGEFDRAIADFDQTHPPRPQASCSVLQSWLLVATEKGSTTGQSPTLTRPFVSVPRLPLRSQNEATRGSKKVSTPERSLTSTRPYSSIPTLHSLATIVDSRGRRRGMTIKRSPTSIKSSVSTPRSPLRSTTEATRGSIKEDNRAIADFDQAILLGPKYPVAFYNRGYSWQRKGQEDRAISDFDEALRLDPNYAKARYARGLTWRQKGEEDKARADFSEAFRLDPKLATPN